MSTYAHSLRHRLISTYLRPRLSSSKLAYVVDTQLVQYRSMENAVRMHRIAHNVIAKLIRFAINHTQGLIPPQTIQIPKQREDDTFAIRSLLFPVYPGCSWCDRIHRPI